MFATTNYNELKLTGKARSEPTEDNKMKAYAVYADNEFNSSSESKEVAVKNSKKLGLNHYYKESKIEIKEIELLSIESSYDEELGGIVDIEISVDDEFIADEFVVQLVGGEHLGQMGCWMTTSESDGDLDIETYKNGCFAAFDSKIITEAENSYEIYVKEKMTEDVNEGEVFEYYEYYDNHTVSATSSTDMCVEKSNQGRFRVYPKNSGFTQPNDYSSLPNFEIEYFESVESYNEFREE